MPAQKNRTLRIVVPIIVIAAAIMIVAAFAINASGVKKKNASSSQPQSQQSPTTEPVDTDDAAPAQEPPAPDAVASQPPTEPTTRAEDRVDVVPATQGLRARTFEATTDPIVIGAAISVQLEERPAGADGSGPLSWTLEWEGLDRRLHSETLGEVDTMSKSQAERARREKESALNLAHGYRMEARLTAVGAGVEQVRVADYYQTIKRRTHYLVQRRIDSYDGSMAAVPLSITGVLVNDQWVDLFNGGPDRRFWRITGSGESAAAFEAVIEDASGAEAVRLRRSYSLAPNTFDIRVDLSIENLTGAPLNIRVVTVGPVELPTDTGGYNIDLARVRFGSLLSDKRDPSRQFVEADRRLMGRAAAVKMVTRPDPVLWPNENLYEGMGELVWTAQTNRYFAFAVHSTPDEGEPKALWAAEKVYPQAFGDAALHLEMHSRQIPVGAGATQTLELGVYAGPVAHRYLNEKADPLFGRIALDDIVIYQLSFGMCAMCTFQWLTELLFTFLNLLHNYVVFDWALAIMVLVVVVRTILHPITKKSQISMMRFGKQMQGLAPKQKAIQEKYKDDRVKMQQEMARLMKEEGVNYANMLGCLPMFLQTPIWIALYAMLYLAFELRHEPAFFGVVQSVFPNWSFLGDLSVGDHFIDFGRTLINIPLMGPITGINLLPFLLGVVFYIQQKYMTPPPTTQLTPEQQSQQKMMKVMMIVLFPVMMYNAPSALAIYFITNSTLGILESRYIRSHVDQDSLVPEKPKHAGLGRKKVDNRASRRHEPVKRFKDRQ